MNKVSSAIHLRFNVNASSLPDYVKARLLRLHDHRITDEGIIVIKAQSHRSQEKNRADAVARLHEMVESASVLPRVRRPTAPTRSSHKKRRETKVRRAGIKSLRSKIVD